MTAYWIGTCPEVFDEAKQAARAAHDSAAYQQALAALDVGAVRDLRIVPGV